jgi:hypothetical protein
MNYSLLMYARSVERIRPWSILCDLRLGPILLLFIRSICSRTNQSTISVLLVGIQPVVIYSLHVTTHIILQDGRQM